MLVTKNTLTNPKIFPIIGENNRVAEEISRRFVKYYKRGIKSEAICRQELLNYTPNIL